MNHFLIFSAAMLATTSAAGAATLGSFDQYHTQTNYFVNGAQYDDLRTAISGAGHTVKAGIDLVTQAYLSDVDVFYTGMINSSGNPEAYATAPEISALQGWVASGGVLVIGGENASYVDSANSWMSPFGLSLAVSSAYNGTYATGSNPLLANGVAGSPTGFLAGSYFAPGSYDTIAGDGTNTYIAGLDYGDGYVIGLGDGSFNRDALDPVNRQFFLNVMDLETTAAVPLPATLPLLAFGLGALGFGLRRRQRSEQ